MNYPDSSTALNPLPLADTETREAFKTNWPPTFTLKFLLLNSVYYLFSFSGFSFCWFVMFVFHLIFLENNVFHAQKQRKTGKKGAILTKNHDPCKMRMRSGKGVRISFSVFSWYYLLLKSIDLVKRVNSFFTDENLKKSKEKALTIKWKQSKLERSVL